MSAPTRAPGSPRHIVVLATRNAGKLQELVPLLAERGCEGLTLDDVGMPEDIAAESALEVHDTFEANALAKARYFAERTGRLVLADDSGLVVDALDGKPGVHSKRWSGAQSASGVALAGAALDAANNRCLQEALEQAAAAGRATRAARYVCAAAAAGPRGWGVACGETTGVLLRAPDGAGGFGYDPFFWSDELAATFAAVSREAKAAVSHRGRAFRALLARLDEFA